MIFDLARPSMRVRHAPSQTCSLKASRFGTPMYVMTRRLADESLKHVSGWLTGCASTYGFG